VNSAFVQGERTATGSGAERTDDRVDLREQRHLYNGFGNALSRGFELVVTPLVFALLGWFLDRWLGTAPLLAVALGAFGFAGVCVRSYLRYTLAMTEHDAELPSRRAAVR
jgi:F0F1-type ATP synthase assembly protein I